MNIVCVSGGSYKSFYLNCFLSLKKCDLLVFNYGIIYDFDVKEELLGNEVVTKEMMTLSLTLKAVVVAGVYAIKKGKRIKSLFVTDGENYFVVPSKFGAIIKVENFTFCVGDENTDYGIFNKIVLTDNKIKLNQNNMSRTKIYVFCDKFGTTIVKNKILSRKFCKYSKICLQ